MKIWDLLMLHFTKPKGAQGIRPLRDLSQANLRQMGCESGSLHHTTHPWDKEPRGQKGPGECQWLTPNFYTKAWSLIQECLAWRSHLPQATIHTKHIHVCAHTQVSKQGASQRRGAFPYFPVLHLREGCFLPSIAILQSFALEQLPGTAHLLIHGGDGDCLGF